MKRLACFLMICVAEIGGVARAEPAASHGYLVLSDGLKMHYVVANDPQ